MHCILCKIQCLASCGHGPGGQGGRGAPDFGNFNALIMATTPIVHIYSSLSASSVFSFSLDRITSWI